MLPVAANCRTCASYFVIVAKSAEGRPEVADFVAWLREEAKESR
jgi:hypothetical protein